MVFITFVLYLYVSREALAVTKIPGGGAGKTARTLINIFIPLTNKNDDDDDDDIYKLCSKENKNNDNNNSDIRLK